MGFTQRQQQVLVAIIWAICLTGALATGGFF